MNAMVNLMREHVPSDARIHYVITNGGQAPNVVPDFAEVYYYARHNDMRVLDGIWERITNAARGAALGTDTKMEIDITGAVWNVLPNEYLAKVMHTHLEAVGGFEYTPAERAFAEAHPQDARRQRCRRSNRPIRFCRRRAGVGTASTDMGDVSWRVPTVQMTAATWVPGTPAHSWQAVAAGGMSIGAKGMMVAAKTMALTAIDLMSNPVAHRARPRRVRQGARCRLQVHDATRRSKTRVGLPQEHRRGPIHSARRRRLITPNEARPAPDAGVTLLWLAFGSAGPGQPPQPPPLLDRPLRVFIDCRGGRMRRGVLPHRTALD